MRDGKSEFSFTYYRDSYNYKDRKGAFNKTFRHDKNTATRANGAAGSGGGNDSLGSRNFGTLQVSMDRYFYRAKSFVDFAYGLNLGIGYNGGYGFFGRDGTQSDVMLSLWTFPVDLALTMGIPLSSWVKVSGSVGPSAILLMQSRGDKETNEHGKNQRQVGTGYFAEADFKISFSNFFPASGLGLYTSHDVTKYYLDLVARTQNYSRFQQDDLSISGSSFGMGFTFEFL
jgi:hypothetical protein